MTRISFFYSISVTSIIGFSLKVFMNTLVFVEEREGWMEKNFPPRKCGQ